MPAYQLYVYEDQKKREALEQKICEQVDACTEINGTIRNRVKKFLIEAGITDISEMNAALRVRYEGYLEKEMKSFMYRLLAFGDSTEFSSIG